MKRFPILHDHSMSIQMATYHIGGRLPRYRITNWVAAVCMESEWQRSPLIRPKSATFIRIRRTRPAWATSTSFRTQVISSHDVALGNHREVTRNFELEVTTLLNFLSRRRSHFSRAWYRTNVRTSGATHVRPHYRQHDANERCRQLSIASGDAPSRIHDVPRYLGEWVSVMFNISRFFGARECSISFAMSSNKWSIVSCHQGSTRYEIYDSLEPTHGFSTISSALLILLRFSQLHLLRYGPFWTLFLNQIKAFASRLLVVFIGWIECLTMDRICLLAGRLRVKLTSEGKMVGHRLVKIRASIHHFKTNFWNCSFWNYLSIFHWSHLEIESESVTCVSRWIIFCACIPSRALISILFNMVPGKIRYGIILSWYLVVVRPVFTNPDDWWCVLMILTCYLP